MSINRITPQEIAMKIKIGPSEGYTIYFVTWNNKTWYEYSLSPYLSNKVTWAFSKHKSQLKYASAIKKSGDILNKYDRNSNFIPTQIKGELS
jgi:hypothetical protein